MNDLINSIINDLKNSKNWKESDQLLIDELKFNLEILEKAKEELLENELVTDITRKAGKKPYFHRSSYIAVYKDHFSHLMRLISALTASPKERVKTKKELREKSKNAIELLQEKYN